MIAQLAANYVFLYRLCLLRVPAIRWVWTILWTACFMGPAPGTPQWHELRRLTEVRSPGMIVADAVE